MAGAQASWTSWTDCTEPETLRTSGRSPERAPAGRPPLLDPAFSGRHHQQESLSFYDVRLESPGFVEPRPRPRGLADTIVQSLDKERAKQDLQRCLAKGLEKGDSELSVEYPVCLVCRRCNPLCRHPQDPHGPCLLVYPRLVVQEGEVHLTLGFLLTMKGATAKECWPGPRSEASQVPPGKEQPPKAKRDGRGSTDPKRETPKCQAQGPGRRLRPARGHPMETTKPRFGSPKAPPKKTRTLNVPSASRSPTQRSKAVPAGRGPPSQAKAPPKRLCFLKRLLLSMKKFWRKLQEKKRTPSSKQDSGASPQKLGSPCEAGGSSSTTLEEEGQGERPWAPRGRGKPTVHSLSVSWDWKKVSKKTLLH